MNKEMPSVEELLKNSLGCCIDSFCSNEPLWELYNLESGTGNFEQSFRGLRDTVNKLITQHTADLQRQLDEAIVKQGIAETDYQRISVKWSVCLSDLETMKNSCRVLQAKLTEAQSQIADAKIWKEDREYFANVFGSGDIYKAVHRFQDLEAQLEQFGGQIVALREVLIAVSEHFRIENIEFPEANDPLQNKIMNLLTSTTEAAERIRREWLDKQLSKLHHEIWLELHHSVHPDDSKYRQGITVCLNILIEQRKALQALKEGGV